jgi:hypothetical protein
MQSQLLPPCVLFFVRLEAQEEERKRKKKMKKEKKQKEKELRKAVDSGEVDPEMAAMGFNFAGFGGSKKG